MLDTHYRKIIQPALNTSGKFLVKLKLTPNKLTILAFITGVGAGALVGFKHYIPAAIVLLLSGYFDLSDGTVARITNNRSPLGAFLDMVLDRMVESAVIMGFYFAKPEFTLIYFLFFISVLFNFSTFTVAGALMKNQGEKSIHYDPGLAERTETFIAFWLMMFFSNYAGHILTVFVIIVFFTGIKRFYTIIKFMQTHK